MKRVLLLVVDGCTSRLLGPALDAGELPLLAQLARRGTLDLDCVSIFPSITPAATASIVTGRYPAAHGISGMSWWNAATDTVSYFGDDVRTILKRGIGEFVKSFLLELNGHRLQAPTFFQLVERHGLQAACINHLIFRGDVPHAVSPPLILKLLPTVDADVTVHGPSWLCLGDFVSTLGTRRTAEVAGGIFHRFGMDDQGTESFLRHLPNAAALPAFTVAYFADYDFESHDRGPRDSLDVLRRLDGRLTDVFDQWGGLDRVLDETAIVLTADHSHSDVGGSDDCGVVLDDILERYRLASPGTGWRDGDELLVCPNMRAAEVYLRRGGVATIDSVCATLLEDPRIDHVIWRSPHDGRDDGFHVATRDRGSLTFWPAAPQSGGVRDEYDAWWEIHGELAAVDASVMDGRLRYGVYPNALERIANGVDHPRTGRLWVTARPGYEFAVRGQHPHHGAGSHGTLHALDSLVPLLIAGGPPRAGGRTSRLVDVVPWCAATLGVPFDLRSGERHRPPSSRASVAAR